MLSCRQMQQCFYRKSITHIRHLSRISTGATLIRLSNSSCTICITNRRNSLSVLPVLQGPTQSVPLQHVQCFSLDHSSGQLQQKLKPKETRQIVESEEQTFGQLSTAQKVVRAGKDATYTVIFLVGIGITGLMFYAIGRELLSGQSPSGVYGKALKLCRKHEELTCAIGEPIKGYGEMNRRGRRRHVSHAEYEKDGVKSMRMKFYVEGPSGKGTVHLEVKQNENKKYEFRYIFVELEDLLRRTIIIEDNR